MLLWSNSVMLHSKFNRLTYFRELSNIERGIFAYFKFKVEFLLSHSVQLFTSFLVKHFAFYENRNVGI
jgi:hypothetical protein